MGKKQYGLPYQGSKNLIAESLAMQIPFAEVFVDLFAGGCAVSHLLMERGKHDIFYLNDLWDAPKVFLHALHGDYESAHNIFYTHTDYDVKRDTDYDVKRDTDYDVKRDTDDIAKYAFSFGGNQTDYIYSKQI